jgi:glycosyltransferase involved in cell wall biosynthesis
MNSLNKTSIESPSFKAIKPKLSVLIPFYKDDAGALIKDLSQQKTTASFEIIIVDDGTGDETLSKKLSVLIQSQKSAVKLITLAQNQGRSAARNHLQKAARADWILFLDADMRPTSEAFLQNYLDLIETNSADVIFGGFKVEETASDRSGELHRALSAVSDCLPLSERQAAGPQYVASSNLCLKKSVITENPFDDGFKGWGWEDSEWAARISQSHRLLHIDNPALHLGLESTETLLNRFKNSGHNYVRFTEKHPELAKTLTLYRLSKTLKNVPGQSFMRPFLKAIVKAPAPMKARLFALKLWRASWYAEALS